MLPQSAKSANAELLRFDKFPRPILGGRFFGSLLLELSRPNLRTISNLGDTDHSLALLKLV